MATSEKRPHIIAVFGGNGVPDDVAALAFAIGGQLAEVDACVLSGGDGTSRGNVKDEAILGARSHGAWIGVLNDTGESRGYKLDDNGLVLKPEMGHQRNLLEAWMCDAAIVLENCAGKGTLSELVSAVCLGKPVLLIGEPDTWAKGRTEWRYVDQWFKSKQIEAGLMSPIIKAARARLDDKAGLMVYLVQTTIVNDSLKLADPCMHMGSSVAAIDAAMWLEERLTEAQTGEIPELGSFSLADVKERENIERLMRGYREWLTAVSL